MTRPRVDHHRRASTRTRAARRAASPCATRSTTRCSSSSRTSVAAQAAVPAVGDPRRDRRAARPGPGPAAGAALATRRRSRASAPRSAAAAAGVRSWLAGRPGPERRVRVLYVERYGLIGGGERSLLGLLGNLPDRVGATLACPRGPLQSAAAASGAAVRRSPPPPPASSSTRSHAGGAQRPCPAPRRASCASDRRVRLDVLHANSVRAGLIALPASRARHPARRPRARPAAAGACRRRSSGGSWTRTWWSRSQRWVAREFDSAGEARRLEVVDNPIDVASFALRSVRRAERGGGGSGSRRRRRRLRPGRPDHAVEGPAEGDRGPRAHAPPRRRGAADRRRPEVRGGRDPLRQPHLSRGAGRARDRARTDGRGAVPRRAGGRPAAAALRTSRSCCRRRSRSAARAFEAMAAGLADARHRRGRAGRDHHRRRTTASCCRRARRALVRRGRRAARRPGAGGGDGRAGARDGDHALRRAGHAERVAALYAGLAPA